MANNYDSFSEAIPNLTPAEEEWIRAIPEAIEFADNPEYEDDEEWVAAFLDKLKALGIDPEGLEDTLEDFPRFVNCIDSDGWWLYSEEAFDAVHVVCVVQAFIKKFRPDMVFTLTWAGTCSKPRLGEFGGGWAAVSKDDAVYGDTWSAAAKAAEALRTGKDKA